MHSASYTSGAAWKGRKALVLGTGNSGHDVAQDLCASGADVTMVQRSPTYVVSIREAQKVYAIYSEGLPFEDCDLLATSMPYPVCCAPISFRRQEMREGPTRTLLKGLGWPGFASPSARTGPAWDDVRCGAAAATTSMLAAPT